MNEKRTDQCKIMQIKREIETIEWRLERDIIEWKSQKKKIANANTGIMIKSKNLWSKYRNDDEFRNKKGNLI